MEGSNRVDDPLAGDPKNERTPEPEERVPEHATTYDTENIKEDIKHSTSAIPLLIFVGGLMALAIIGSLIGLAITHLD